MTDTEQTSTDTEYIPLTYITRDDIFYSLLDVLQIDEQEEDDVPKIKEITEFIDSLTLDEMKNIAFTAKMRMFHRNSFQEIFWTTLGEVSNFYLKNDYLENK